MQLDQSPSPSENPGPEALPAGGSSLNGAAAFSEQQRQRIEAIPTPVFVPQGMHALREYHHVLDLVIQQIDLAHYGCYNPNGVVENHLPTLKAMAPTADAVMDRLAGEDVSPEGRLMLSSARRILSGAIEQYPKVPYYGASPAKEFQIGRDMLGVAMRMIELGFYQPAAGKAA